MAGPRGLAGAQQGCSATSAWPTANQSVVHSQTFPAMSNRPKPFGGKLPTGAVPAKPSASKFRQGKGPCQVFAKWRPAGASSSPHTYSAASSPPRAAHSHSASVGRVLPDQAAKAAASSKAIWTTGCSPRPTRSLPGPSGCRQQAPGVQCHHWLKSLVSTGPSVMRKTSAPGTRSSGFAPG